jgi:hypothetical protein
MTTQHQMFKTLISEAHSLYAQPNGKIKLIIEVEASDRKTALDDFSKPGAALAIVRLPPAYDRNPCERHCCEETEESEDEITLH